MQPRFVPAGLSGGDDESSALDLTPWARGGGPSKLGQHDAAPIASDEDLGAVVEGQREPTADEGAYGSDPVSVHEPAAVNAQKSITSEVACEARDGHSALDHATAFEVNPHVVARCLDERDVVDADGHLSEARLHQYYAKRAAGGGLRSRRCPNAL